ncbi:3'-5' DNA helicase [Tieghemiomyces parasiticus]|uniref:DNA helicase n=1 Tax=Tieghemiomyces parasiticus TaxID=78921 RepID=A0A9W8AAR0_9FUNG|nr:3'-5' DNA helicase [Tieghemiomyces parasiticus]
MSANEFAIDLDDWSDDGDSEAAMLQAMAAVEERVTPTSAFSGPSRPPQPTQASTRTPPVRPTSGPANTAPGAAPPRSFAPLSFSSSSGGHITSRSAGPPHTGKQRQSLLPFGLNHATPIPAAIGQGDFQARPIPSLGRVRQVRTSSPTAVQIRLAPVVQGPAAIRRLWDSDKPDPAAGPCPHRHDPAAVHEWIYPTNYAKREYQFNIVQKALAKNTLVALPTGLGKTFIAAVVMYNFYRWFPDGKVIFMAPTKPLVAQQIGACYEICGIPPVDTAEMTGSQLPKARVDLWQTKRVFFLTPQVMQNDLRRETCPAGQVVCLVVDEAHRAQGNQAYCEVVRELTMRNRHFRVLALTATPGNDREVVQAVIDNLQIATIELRTEESADIVKYLHGRSVDQVEVALGEHLSRFHAELNAIIGGYVDQLKHTGCGRLFNNPSQLTHYQVQMARNRVREMSHRDPNLARNMMFIESRFAIIAPLGQALQLLNYHGVRSCLSKLEAFRAESLAKGQSCSKVRRDLFNSAAFQGLLERMNAHANDPQMLSHPKLERLVGILLAHIAGTTAAPVAPGPTDDPPAAPPPPVTEAPSSRVIVFSQYRESVEEIVALLSQHDPLLRVASFVGQSTGKAGKGLTQKAQLEILQKFKSGHFNVLVATSIGEEGLDIGEVDLIVCFDTQGSPIRLLQRMGRTGRKRRGRIVVLLTEGGEAALLQKSQTSYRKVQEGIMSDKWQLKYFTQSARMVPAPIVPKCNEQSIVIPERSPPKSAVKSRGRKAAAAVISDDEGGGDASSSSKKGAKVQRTGRARKAATVIPMLTDDEDNGSNLPSPMDVKPAVGKPSRKSTVARTTQPTPATAPRDYAMEMDDDWDMDLPSVDLRDLTLHQDGASKALVKQEPRQEAGRGQPKASQTQPDQGDDGLAFLRWSDEDNDDFVVPPHGHLTTRNAPVKAEQRPSAIKLHPATEVEPSPWDTLLTTIATRPPLDPPLPFEPGSTWQPLPEKDFLIPNESAFARPPLPGADWDPQTTIEWSGPPGAPSSNSQPPMTHSPPQPPVPIWVIDSDSDLDQVVLISQPSNPPVKAASNPQTVGATLIPATESHSTPPKTAPLDWAVTPPRVHRCKEDTPASPSPAIHRRPAKRPRNVLTSPTPNRPTQRALILSSPTSPNSTTAASPLRTPDSPSASRRIFRLGQRRGRQEEARQRPTRAQASAAMTAAALRQPTATTFFDVEAGMSGSDHSQDESEGEEDAYDRSFIVDDSEPHHGSPDLSDQRRRMQATYHRSLMSPDSAVKLNSNTTGPSPLKFRTRAGQFAPGAHARLKLRHLSLLRPGLGEGYLDDDELDDLSDESDGDAMNRPIFTDDEDEGTARDVDESQATGPSTADTTPTVARVVDVLGGGDRPRPTAALVDDIESEDDLFPPGSLPPPLSQPEALIISESDTSPDRPLPLSRKSLSMLSSPADLPPHTLSERGPGCPPRLPSASTPLQPELPAAAADDYQGTGGAQRNLFSTRCTSRLAFARSASVGLPPAHTSSGVARSQSFLGNAPVARHPAGGPGETTEPADVMSDGQGGLGPAVLPSERNAVAVVISDNDDDIVWQLKDKGDTSLSKLTSRSATFPLDLQSPHKSTATSTTATPPLIVVDTHELRTAIPSILKNRHGIPNRVHSLHGAQFVISRRSGVKRKTRNDLIAAVGAKTLMDEIQNFRACFERTYLIVEYDGDAAGSDPTAMGAEKGASLTGAASVAARKKKSAVVETISASKQYDEALEVLARMEVTLLFSEGRHETADLLSWLVNEEARAGAGFHDPADVDDGPHFRFLVNVPGVSDVVAWNILSSGLKSVQELVNWELSDRAVPFMNEDRARLIYDYFRVLPSANSS